MADPRAVRRLLRNPAAWVSAAILLVAVLACVVGPWFLPASLGEPGPNQPR